MARAALVQGSQCRRRRAGGQREHACWQGSGCHSTGASPSGTERERRRGASGALLLVWRTGIAARFSCCLTVLSVPCISPEVVCLQLDCTDPQPWVHARRSSVTCRRCCLYAARDGPRHCAWCCAHGRVQYGCMPPWPNGRTASVHPCKWCRSSPHHLCPHFLDMDSSTKRRRWDATPPSPCCQVGRTMTVG